MFSDFKKNLLFFGIIFYSFFEIASVFADVPIVYSRCKRTTEQMTIVENVTVGGVPQVASRTLTKFDIYDAMPGVARFFSRGTADQFTAPCDLVYRDANGAETIIYDCSSTSTMSSSCSALEPQVAWDGNRIVFTVYSGTLRQNSDHIDLRILNPDADKATSAASYTMPNTFLQATGAHLLLYNVNTQQTVDITPFQTGVWDQGATFIGQNRIAFTSTRDGHTTPAIWNFNSSRPGTRIYSINVDGTDLELDSHHSTSQEQHPFMLKNGNIAYSSWQIFAGVPFRHNNGTAGNASTDENFFFPYFQRPDGSRNFPIFGQHSCDHVDCYFGEDNIAGHFITQTTDERIWFNNYYRLNNNGMGVLIGVMQEPFGMEGKGFSEISSYADLFVPRDAINFAPWSYNGDNFSTVLISPAVTHVNYTDPIPWGGKVGHGFALPSNELGLSWAAGACNNATSHFLAYQALGLPVPPATSGGGAFTELNSVQSLNLDIPGCDIGIYKASVIPSVHPTDLTLIVDSPDWHEIMARAVVPYSQLYGVSEPTIIERSDIRTPHPSLNKGTPFGLLGAASITDRETDPYAGHKYPGTYDNHFEHQFNLQGTNTIEFNDDDLCGIRIIGILPNRSENVANFSGAYEILNIFGERTAILGEIPVLHYDGQGSRILDPNNNPDTSFLVKMPANVPHMLQGIDCDGHTLNTDQTWQTVKPGEVKTCGGCHVHSRPEALSFNQSYASTQNYTIPEIGTGSVQLLDGKVGNTVNTKTINNSYGYQITFNDDIVPIFNDKCISCHGGATPAGGLNLDTTGQTNNQLACTVWNTLVADRYQTCLDAPYKKFLNNNDQYNFRRPWLTKYMVAFNPLQSLLYWKAAGQRMDGLSDGTRSDDIDFGAAHPTTATSDELGILQRWITLGAPGGPQETKDTQYPTLNVAATVNGSNEITHLHIGAVDFGSGIDVNTLIVQINGGANIAPTATLDGITNIALGTPISNITDVITVKIKDNNNNETVVNRTANYFIVDAAGPSGVTVNAGSNITINEGSTFNRTISFTDGEDTNNDGWTYSIDWGDGSQPETGTIAAGLSTLNISKAFPDGFNQYTVSITITDVAITDTDTGSFVLTVDNVAPTGTISGDSEVDTNVPYTITISNIVDPGDDTVTSQLVDWGDGTSNNLLTHTYTEENLNTVITVSLIDEDGTFSIGTFNLTVNSGIPTITFDAGKDAVINEGDTFSRSIVFVDAEDTNNDGWTYSIDWDDGTAAETGSIATGLSSLNISRTFADGPAFHTIAVTITDTAVTDTFTDSLLLTVNNVAPTGTISGDASVNAGIPYTITLDLFDPGDDTITANIIDWGNGIINNALTNTYQNPGNYAIIVNVTDEDGTFEIGWRDVIVNPRTPENVILDRPY